MGLRFPTVFMCVALASLGASAATPETPSRTQQGLTATEWQGIRAAHEAWKHRFIEEEDGVVSAVNPGQRWRTEFDGRGFTAQPSGQNWKWGLELKSYGIGDSRVEPRGRPRIETSERQLTYHWSKNLREWFLNDVRGLEQGWTLQSRPEGDGGTLRIELAVRGGLEADVSERSIAFADKDRAARLHYGGLKAWDATGRALPVRFLAASEGIAVEVEEHDAVYPVTIDPLAQQAFLKASNTGTEDGFGVSAAISGNTVVIGAPAEDSSSAGVNSPPNDLAPNAGAAYVFVRNGTTWTQQAYLKPLNPDASDRFGTSVAISGNTIVVGAFSEDGSTTIVNSTPDNLAANAGAAYVFVRSGTTWSQQAYLKADNAGANDQFGISVAIDGNTIVVGAFTEDDIASDSGAAYVFVRSGTTWSQQGSSLKADNAGSGDQFGSFVSISGNTIAVGAPTEGSNATGINGDGTNNLAGHSGAAYVFVRSGTTWNQEAYVKPHNTGSGDWFGRSLAISGNTLVVGAHWEDSDTTGINSTGNESATDAGAAYVFARTGTIWVQEAYLKADNTGAEDNFGYAVAVSGNTVVVGARYEDGSGTGVNSESDNVESNAGAAYTFIRNGGIWSQQAYLKASNTESGDNFGNAVAISGSTIVVGAINEASSSLGVNGISNNFAPQSGAAYVFDIPLPPPTAPTVKISGKKKVKTTKPSYTVKGTAADANNDLRRVEARDVRPKGKKKYRPAKGTAKWKYTAKLKPGSNRIRVRAVDVTGKFSPIQTVTVIRK